MKTLILGSAGMLGTQLLKRIGNNVVGYDLPKLDITNKNMINKVVDKENPDLIINSSAITDVDFCEQNKHKADAVHYHGVRYLAETGIRLITISTDQVFSEISNRYILESDTPSPQNYYAISKYMGEKEALRFSQNVVVRTSWLFHTKGLLPWIITKLNNGETVSAVTDQTACITSVDSLVETLIKLSIDREKKGLYHCVNSGAVTPFTLATIIKEKIGKGNVKPVTWSSLNLSAIRPFWSALGTERELVTPSMEEEIEKCIKRML